MDRISKYLTLTFGKSCVNPRAMPQNAEYETLINTSRDVRYSPEALHGWRGLLALSRALLAVLALWNFFGVAHVEARGATGVVLLVETCLCLKITLGIGD